MSKDIMTPEKLIPAIATGGLSLAAEQAFNALSPATPDMPDAPPPPVPEAATEMPDPDNPVKKKQKQASILKSVKGGSGDTILSGGAFKLGG